MKPKKYFIVLSMAALLFPLMTHAKFSPSEKKDIENAREWIEAERVIFSDSKKKIKKIWKHVIVLVTRLKNLPPFNANVIANAVKNHRRVRVMAHKTWCA
ncbi:MAG: hypothetical protein KAG10_00450 [Methylococcales bacterium]|nr:hypothetical protein [Methylococcales bacterium]MCK5924341.1 hypothetical protein [Methylococcales bacterium]